MSRIRIRPENANLHMHITEHDNGVSVTSPSYPQGKLVLNDDDFDANLKALIEDEKAIIQEAIDNIKVNAEKQLAEQEPQFTEHVNKILDKYA